MPAEVPNVTGLLDSGAFSDSPEERLSEEEALLRQIRWESEAARFWGAPWQAEAVVSYDLLVDEKWLSGVRIKERCSVAEAEHKVRVTVDAAAYLASQRERLQPRQLVLACQGVDATQYAECVEGVLAYALPQDWIGLGGWCILGQQRSWLPVFWDAMRRCLPKIAAAGVCRVHIFGVLWEPALAGLLWLCDQHGLALSTDSSGPVLSVTWSDAKKAGNRLADTWEENVRLWRERLAGLRQSQHYREPVERRTYRQLLLW